MLDAVQIPILLKAIDFVFDEGRRILEERRERRKAEANAAQTQVPQTEAEVLPLPPEQAEAAKNDLTAAKIDELLWQNHEAEVRHLVTLLETYSRNYHLSKEQYAKWGSALVPPIIVHNLTEAENAMLNTLKQLEAALSKVYKKDIQATQ
ncbi:MAG: hypothetical protein AB1509_00030 [Chloroflexota bacterium]